MHSIGHVAQPSQIKTELEACLELSEKYSDATHLKNTIGDGFLYATSSLYKKVRDTVLSSGYVVIGDLTQESYDYFLTNIFQLDKVLFEKKIFARPNRSALMQIAQKYQNHIESLREITLLESYSLHFHESIHCIIANRFSWKSLNLNLHHNPQLLLEQILVAEATALSFEYILCTQYSKPEEKSLVFMNALGRVRYEGVEAFKALAQADSFESAALWIFRGYFASMFFYQLGQPVPGMFQTVLRQCMPKENWHIKHLSLMEIVFNAGFELNFGFRNASAAVFFKTIGVEGDLKNAFSFNIYETLEINRWPTNFFKGLLHEFAIDKSLN